VRTRPTCECARGRGRTCSASRSNSTRDLADAARFDGRFDRVFVAVDDHPDLLADAPADDLAAWVAAETDRRPGAV
jgi:hypothetical protein